MASLTTLKNKIWRMVGHTIPHTTTQLTAFCNEAVDNIAAGIRMPNGDISAPLPDLQDTDTVDTATDAAYAALPDDYMRGLYLVADSSGDKIAAPKGGDYYSFKLFMKHHAIEKDLSEAGSVHHAVVKGSNLYYQGIPTASVALTVWFYRAPEAMSKTTDTPDGIPDHLQLRLICHYACKEILGELLHRTKKEEELKVLLIGKKYHKTEFFEAMQDLVNFIGIDAEPMYYGSDSGSYVDAGICD